MATKFAQKTRWEGGIKTQSGNKLFLVKDLLYAWFQVVSISFWVIFSFTDTDNSQCSRGGEEGTIFYSTLPLPPAHEHSDIYLQLCAWDDYHIFLVATLVCTRLLCYSMGFTTLSDYYLIDWLMMWCWFLFVSLLIWF